MAKFVAYYNLCPIHDPKEFLGIAEDRDKENIIATLGRNIVIIIKISTQKQVRSWSVVEKLSSKVIYDRCSQKYVGVFANRILRCWDHTQTDINKCKKLKFQRRIADIISGEEGTYVLYYDGGCEKLTKAIQTRQTQVKAPQEDEISTTHTFSDASIRRLPSGYHIITYFDLNNTTGQLELVRVPLESGAPTRFTLERENINVRVTGSAVIEGDEAPMLLTIWSDKRLFLLSLCDSTLPDVSPGDFVSMMSPLDVDQPLSVVGISKHYVAIYGANSGQDSATLLLYNTQFKLVKAKQYFKVYFNFSRLWSMDDYILLGMGQNLSVVSYHMSKELLSELLGTQLDSDFETLAEHINEEESLHECLQYRNESHQDEYASGAVEHNGFKEAEMSSSYDILEADGKLKPFENLRDFDSTFNALNRLHMCVDVAKVGTDESQVTLMTNCTDNWSEASSDLQLLAQAMEQGGFSEHEITEKLLSVLINTSSMTDIVMCLQRYSNISEKMLAKTLNYALEKLEAKPESSAPQMNGSIDDSVYAMDVLNAVLSCSFEAAIMATHIRHEIDYANVLLLLKHLYAQLHNSLDERSSLEPTYVDFEMQLLRWFGVCLNTHFQELALSKDVRLIELLTKWQQLFDSYKCEIAELEQLTTLLHNIVLRKAIHKVRNYSKWYAIEEVDLY